MKKQISYHNAQRFFDLIVNDDEELPYGSTETSLLKKHLTLPYPYCEMFFGENTFPKGCVNETATVEISFVPLSNAKKAYQYRTADEILNVLYSHIDNTKSPIGLAIKLLAEKYKVTLLREVDNNDRN